MIAMLYFLLCVFESDEVNDKEAGFIGKIVCFNVLVSENQSTVRAEGDLLVKAKARSRYVADGI